MRFPNLIKARLHYFIEIVIQFAKNQNCRACNLLGDENFSPKIDTLGKLLFAIGDEQYHLGCIDVE